MKCLIARKQRIEFKEGFELFDTFIVIKPRIMQNRKSVGTLVIFLFFTLFSFSQSIGTSASGEDGLYSEYQKSDLELNIVYNQLREKLGKTDKEALVNAQKAWSQFRDLNCKFTNKEESEGGVMANKMKIDCLTQATRERTKQLKELMDDF